MELYSQGIDSILVTSYFRPVTASDLSSGRSKLRIRIDRMIPPCITAPLDETVFFPFPFSITPSLSPHRHPPAQSRQNGDGVRSAVVQPAAGLSLLDLLFQDEQGSPPLSTPVSTARNNPP